MDGWEDMSDKIGNMFYGMISHSGFKNIVEIGVMFGHTTKYLCKAAKRTGGKVYGFDLFDVHGLKNQFTVHSQKQNVEDMLLSNGYTNFELHTVNTTTEEFDKQLDKIKTIDFCFIDGCHSYQGLSNDFNKVISFLSDHAIVVFHDTSDIDGCREMVIELRQNKKFTAMFDMLELYFSKGLFILKKRSPNPIAINEICNLDDHTNRIYKSEINFFKSVWEKC